MGPIRRWSRRRAIRAGLAGATVGLAGCSDVIRGGSRGAPEPTGETFAVSTETATPPLPSPGDTWTTFQFDAGNTGHAPENAGPTAAVDARWRAAVGSSVAASPLVADGVVFVAATDTYLHAFRWDTGDLLGRFPTDDFITSTPVLGDETLYLASRDGLVYALIAETFRTPELILERWRHDSRNGIFGSLTTADGTLFAGNQNGNCFAIDVAAGVRRWTTVVGDFVDTAAAVGDGLVYVSSPGGLLYALDAGDGSIRWRTPLDGGLATAPTIADGTVFIGTTGHQVYGLAHRMYAFDVDDGTERWSVEPSDSASTSAAVADGTVYLGTWDGTLYALSADTGEEQFTVDLGSPIRADPAVASGTVYAGTQGGHLVGVDVADGTDRLRFRADGAIASAPAVAGGTVVFGTDAGSVYALAER